MDLNMLSSDFYVIKTSSKNGNGYDDFFSSSISKVQYPNPMPLLMLLICS